MKLYITADMEGITGLPDETFVDSRQHNYERGRRIMTQEVNVILKAAYAHGAASILVNDSHSKMNNLLIEELHPEAQLITGNVKPYSMMQGLDNTYDGAFFVGYHARAGTFGVMSHAMVHAIRNFSLNGERMGEMGMNAYLAGHYGVPVLLVAGDDQAVKEAQELIPNVTTAAVKETISRSAVKSLTPAKAGELLAEQTASALANKDKVKPLHPPENPELKIEFTNYGQAEWAHLMPGTSLDPEEPIVTYQAKDVPEAYQAMLVMTELAMRTAFS